MSSLEEVKPKKIYVSSDAGRNNVEQAEVNLVRDYISNFIYWDCEVLNLYQSANLGCQKCIDYAIKYVFEREDSALILEDDCIPSIPFFNYMKVALKEYEERLDISAISGRNHLNEFNSFSSEAILTDRFFCWGWATWKNRVSNILIDEVVDIGLLDIYRLTSGEQLRTKLFVLQIIGLLKTKQVNSWAYAYDLYFRLNNSYCLVPKLNYINNIGFEGTHSNSWNSDPVHLEEKVIINLEGVCPEYNRDFSVQVNKQECNNILLQFFITLLSWVPGSRKIKRKLGDIINA
ncbi:hypothetical protein [Vibrio cyclitrophicus]|uniref:hypothetical protein n=1 Tax=Vibrio cyclitrophicus TaxID=47951 RepID=UPI001055C4B1|nr:hypothetical protein [Vibrio cyclitrophicus]